MGRLRVATFNIQHGRGPDGRVDLARLGDACARLDADVLGLQEVDAGVPRSHHADLVAVVADATGMNAEFGPVTTIDGGRYGNALLARAEMTEVGRIALPGAARREPRGAVLGRVDDVSVAVTHLSVGADLHARQLVAVRDALVSRAGPWVLIGDLNHDQPDLPGFALVGGGPTFPAHAPKARIDHIAVIGLRVESIEVVELNVSDHRALVATLSR